ncbi:MAG: hypothetical protein U0990_03240 [Candidatus Nanopelagicales bacterium]|nr:hypothetical protein [Candidatus Nanopelagicales bacterium]MDZ4249087.1 hypothetical protein [Candidatus Nanopelagicales bacterium]
MKSFPASESAVSVLNADALGCSSCEFFNRETQKSEAWRIQMVDWKQAGEMGGIQ